VPVDRIAVLRHLAVAPDRRPVDLVAREAIRSPLVQVRLRGLAQGRGRSDCRLGHAAPLPHAAYFHLWTQHSIYGTFLPSDAILGRQSAAVKEPSGAWLAPRRCGRACRAWREEKGAECERDGRLRRWEPDGGARSGQRWRRAPAPGRAVDAGRV